MIFALFHRQAAGDIHSCKLLYVHFKYGMEWTFGVYLELYYLLWLRFM